MPKITLSAALHATVCLVTTIALLACVDGPSAFFPNRSNRPHFTRSQHDLGRHPQGSKISKSIELRNPLPYPVNIDLIQSTEPSWGVSPQHSLIQPEGSTQLTIQGTDYIVGKYNHQITVVTDHGFARCRVTGEVLPVPTLSPRRKIIGTFVDAQSAAIPHQLALHNLALTSRESFQVRSNDESPYFACQVIASEASDDLITVTLSVTLVSTPPAGLHFESWSITPIQPADAVGLDFEIGAEIVTSHANIGDGDTPHAK